ncbi:MAG: hypothetical protein FJW20_14865 [Acidimicrobiia bacterium]|nr:hypothetical protein [Acidimicrobiia bacterium]
MDRAACSRGDGFRKETGYWPRAIAGPILVGIGGLICLIMTILSLPRLIAGIGLLQHRGWARILTIVISVLGLLDFPFGTALGVYGLWVLLSPEGTALFEQQQLTRPA